MPTFRDREMSKMLAGAAAGLAATVPMTLAMEAMYRRLPWTQREPLPPRKITERALAALGVRHELDESERFALTLANHFGYGTAMGALYGPLSSRVPGPAVAKGMGYGLMVWAVSYLGLLPAVGLMRPATQQRAGRNVLMILAHLVWGGALGMLSARWIENARGSRQRSSRRSPRRLAAPLAGRGQRASSSQRARERQPSSPRRASAAAKRAARSASRS